MFKAEFLEALGDYSLAMYLEKTVEFSDEAIAVECDSLGSMNLIQGSFGIAIAAAAERVGAKAVHFSADGESVALAVDHTPQSLRGLCVQLKNSTYEGGTQGLSVPQSKDFENHV